MILGATGMLGRAVVRSFSNFDGQVTITSRPGSKAELTSDSRLVSFDAEKQNLSALPREKFDYIINCIGLIKSEIKENSARSIQSAVDLNVNLPLKLADYSARTGTKVLQIATDCVFSGFRGSYLESDPHDPLDVYGKTKSLGEVPSDHIMHLRVSIIGKEARCHTSLYDWVRFQPKGAEILGFADHYWNGVTTNALGQVFRGIVEDGLFKSGVHHLLPANVVTKAELVKLIASNEGRNDIKITIGPSGNPVDRSLASENQDYSLQLWNSAGYDEAPTIQDLVSGI